MFQLDPCVPRISGIGMPVRTASIDRLVLAPLPLSLSPPASIKNTFLRNIHPNTSTTTLSPRLYTALGNQIGHHTPELPLKALPLAVVDTRQFRLFPFTSVHIHTPTQQPT